MRKVFINAMPLNPIGESHVCYESDDYGFNFKKKQYKFALSYFVDAYVEDNDEVLFINTVQPNEFNGIEQRNNSEKNLKLYKDEVDSIITGREGVKPRFEEAFTQRDFAGGHSLHTCFKKVAKLLQDGDKIYMDVTRGDKPHSMALFMAVVSAVRLCKDAEIVENIYCGKFSGNRELDETRPTKIINMSGLVLLNLLSYEFDSKVEFDASLDAIIKD